MSGFYFTAKRLLFSFSPEVFQNCIFVYLIHLSERLLVVGRTTLIVSEHLLFVQMSVGVVVYDQRRWNLISPYGECSWETIFFFKKVKDFFFIVPKHKSESFNREQVFAYSLCKQTLTKQHLLNLVQSTADLQKLLGTITPVWLPIWQGKKCCKLHFINTFVWKSSGVLVTFYTSMNCPH